MRFVIYRDKAGEFRWGLKARNGRVLCDSGEGYKREAACWKAVERFQDGVTLADYTYLDPDLKSFARRFGLKPVKAKRRKPR